MKYVLFLMLAPCCLAAESEVAASSSRWLVELMQFVEPAVWSILGVVITWLIAKLLKKMEADATYAQVCVAIREGVDKAQEEFVTWRKRAAEDGKLTKAERTEAMMIAWRYAKNTLTGEAAKLLSTWTFNRVQSIIKQYVEKKKAADNKTIIEVTEAANVDNNTANSGVAPAAAVGNLAAGQGA